MSKKEVDPRYWSLLERLAEYENINYLKRLEEFQRESAKTN